ncbi:MAG: hypothetical protein UT82_C0014G0018 [Parcubacteria group bacterium GW2011_GWB1_40_14]|nr:MAG: hypothetical protein UT82_C0014G0018 [Parcubacteria group bacterium GW2011_GWB1_40_14]
MKLFSIKKDLETIKDFWRFFSNRFPLVSKLINVLSVLLKWILIIIIPISIFFGLLGFLSELPERTVYDKCGRKPTVYVAPRTDSCKLAENLKDLLQESPNFIDSEEKKRERLELYEELCKSQKTRQVQAAQEYENYQNCRSKVLEMFFWN